MKDESNLKNSASRQAGQLVALLGLLLLGLTACGLTTPANYPKNQVRLAVYQYEQTTRGPVDELLLFFNRGEPRISFAGQNTHGGRTVWLDKFSLPEYFDLRSPARSYLYIQDIQFLPDNSQATAVVYRGQNGTYRGWELSLSKTDGGWQVAAETGLNPE